MNVALWLVLLMLGTQLGAALSQGIQHWCVVLLGLAAAVLLIYAVGDRPTGIFIDAGGLLGVFCRRWFGHGDGDDFERIASLSCL